MQCASHMQRCMRCMQMNTTSNNATLNNKAGEALSGLLAKPRCQHQLSAHAPLAFFKGCLPAHGPLHQVRAAQRQLAPCMSQDAAACHL